MYLALIGFLIFMVVFSVVMLQHFWHDIFSMAPFVPTSKARVRQLIDFAQIKTGETVIDLGCGDGRLLVAAAKQGANCIGYEISWVPYLWAKFNSRKYSDIKIIRSNFMKVDLSKADIVFAYLLPKKSYDKLRIKLQTELVGNAKVVVEAFSFKNWQHSIINNFEDGGSVYIYKVN